MLLISQRLKKRARHLTLIVIYHQGLKKLAVEIRVRVEVHQEHLVVAQVLVYVHSLIPSNPGSNHSGALLTDACPTPT